MKKLSDSDLQSMLQQKMLDYEADVPEQTEQQVLAHLKQLQFVSRPGKIWAKYAVIAALIILPAIFYFTVTTEMSSQYVASFAETRLPEASTAPSSSPGSVAEGMIAKNDEASAVLNKLKGGKVTGSARQAEQKAFSKPENTIHASENNLGRRSRIEHTIRDESIRMKSSPAQAIEAASQSTVSTEIETAEKDTATANSGKELPSKNDQKTKRLIRVTIGATPFLSYRRITPNRADAVELSEFSTPSAFSTERMGIRLSTVADFEVWENRFLSFGVAYTRYKTSFSYQSNEVIRDVELLNNVNETVSALGLSAAIRYPIRARAERKQYISLGVDGQSLLSKNTTSSGRNLYSLTLGYANDFPLDKSIIRITPVVNYSLTRFQYGGVQALPFWIGVEAAWSFNVTK